MGVTASTASNNLVLKIMNNADTGTCGVDFSTGLLNVRS